MTGLSSWMGGAFVVGLLAGLWGHTKAWLMRLVSLVVVRARVEDDAALAVARLCWAKFRRSRFGERRFGGFHEFVRPLKRHMTVGFESVGTDPVLFRCGWRFLLLSYQPATGGERHMPCGTTLTFLRGMWNLDGLLLEALDHHNAAMAGGDTGKRYAVHRRAGRRRRRDASGGQDESGGGEPPALRNPGNCERLLRWKREELGADRGGEQPWGALAFSEDVVSLRLDACHWLASEGWYRERRVPWRRGYLLHGKPGTGKTSFVRALAQQLDLPVTTFDLATFGNDDFAVVWKRLLDQAPCIALVEDIDAVFDGRKNVNAGSDDGALTFDCFLNCLSGIESADGVLVVITTNNVASLDAALGKPEAGTDISTRPGRIDRAVEFGNPDEICRRQIARRILADVPELVEDMVKDGVVDSGAQFTERCARVALERFWATGGGR